MSECALCRAIISQIDKLLGDSKVDAEIEDVVKKVCKYLPTNKQDTVISDYFTIFFFLRRTNKFKLKFKSVQCKRMVDIYGPSIINMLKANVDSEKMCEKMALCSSNDYFAMSFKGPRVSRSIDYKLKMCTWGNQYVCQNEDVTRSCNVSMQMCEIGN